MNETLVTLVGNVVADPRSTVLTDGTFLASFRLASTSRRFDRSTQAWRDQDTVYVTVLCWRQLGENVADSLFRGAPVVVTGRLATKTYDTRTGERRLAVEVEVAAVGLDLSRGKGSLFRGNRSRMIQPGAPSTPSGDPQGASSSGDPSDGTRPVGEPEPSTPESESVDAA